MAANLISFPFRLGPTGAVVVKPDDSDEYYGEELALLIQTLPGERPQVPQYGINDPTFSELDPNELLAKVSMFGPPVTITSLTAEVVDDVSQDVIVSFEALFTQQSQNSRS